MDRFDLKVFLNTERVRGEEAWAWSSTMGLTSLSRRTC